MRASINISEKSLQQPHFWPRSRLTCAGFTFWAHWHPPGTTCSFRKPNIRRGILILNTNLPSAVSLLILILNVYYTPCFRLNAWAIEYRLVSPTFAQLALERILWSSREYFSARRNACGALPRKDKEVENRQQPLSKLIKSINDSHLFWQQTIRGGETIEYMTPGQIRA